MRAKRLRFCAARGSLSRRNENVIGVAIVLVVAAACGGSTGTSSSGNGGSGGGGGSGGACVTVDPASLPKSCGKDDDCTAVAAGMLCDGGCGCGNTPMAKSGLAQYEARISGVHLLACPCAAEEVRCIQQVCTSCGAGGVVCGDQ